MKENPKLSVIVPVYNTKRYLRACIESILSSTFQDFEVILIDDGSPDGAGELCDELCTRENGSLPFVRCIHQRNSGLSVARNIGVKEAKGEWIAFVDSDDTIESTMYEKMFAVQEKSKADMIICSTNYMSEDGIKKKSIRLPQGINEGFVEVIKSTQMISDLRWIGEYNGNLFVAAWNKLYRRKFLLCNPYKAGVKYEDDLLANTLYLTNYKIAIIHTAFYNYRQNPNSITHEVFSHDRANVLGIMHDRVKIFSQNGYLKEAEYVAKLFVELYIEYYFRAEAVGNQKLIKKYSCYYKDMVQQGSKSISSMVDKVKFRVRTILFYHNPELYLKCLTTTIRG